MAYTPSLKKAVYKWRETHIEQFKNLNSKHHKTYYQKQKEKKELYRMECREFMNILIEQEDNKSILIRM
jgi:hypothetical protein